MQDTQIGLWYLWCDLVREGPQIALERLGDDGSSEDADSSEDVDPAAPHSTSSREHMCTAESRPPRPS